MGTSIIAAQAVPKFQLGCKKIRLLSDRTSKSKLEEKWWRSEMVEAGSDLLRMRRFALRILKNHTFSEP
jgi:hypothetical protein